MNNRQLKYGDTRQEDRLVLLCFGAIFLIACGILVWALIHVTTQ